VLLILVATVSVYTCAILAGAALGRTLDRLPTTKQPPADSTLRVSVSFRGLAQDFAKELWGGYYRESRSGGGAHASSGDRAAAALPSSAARANLPLSPAELENLQYRVRLNMLAQRAATRREISRRDGVHEGAATSRPAELWVGHHSEGRSRTGAGAGGGAASLSAANYQIMMQQVQVEDLHRDISRGERMASTVQQTARPLSRHSNFSSEITEGTLAGGGVVKVGPWGGSGGQAFYMRSGRGGSPPRLLSVTLYHADAVHAFSFQYLHGDVVRTTEPSAGHYYGSKGLRATINFASDEHLTAVEGTFGRCRSVPAKVVVTSLTFRTNKGRTYGPYGEENGTPFSIPAANGCIVGFWGRSGWLLDVIGVYIMPCQAYNPTFFVNNAYEASS